MKKLCNQRGAFAFAAILVFSTAACDKELPYLEDMWAEYSQGNTYRPINIPEIQWRGDTRELGGGAWTANIVTTTKQANGSFKYDLTRQGGAGAAYPVYDVLYVKPAGETVGEGGAIINSSNRSSYITPGIVFMYDHKQEIRDNWYEGQNVRAYLMGQGINPDTMTNAELAAWGYPDGIPNQYDNYYPGILKVHEAVFERYIAFVLRVHSSTGTHEYLIMPQRGQYRNHGGDGGSINVEGDSYIFYIEDQNITSVWLERYIETEIPDNPPLRDPDPPVSENEPLLPPPDDPPPFHPAEDDDPYGTALISTPPERTGNKFVIISVASEGGAEVDPGNKWMFAGRPIKTYWDDMVKAGSPEAFRRMEAIRNSEGRRAGWIWDREDSWAYGVSGCFTVISASRFYIGNQENVVESTVPFYFACDNAAVIYVNGRLAGSTTEAFKDRRQNPGATSDWRFTGLSNDDFEGEVWDRMYEVDIKPLLTPGYNEIQIMAANNDSSGGRWNDTNNPAGLLFACEFTVK